MENKKITSRQFSSNDFLASMSHEIRTPMNGILGLSTILQEMEMSDEQKKLIGLISNSVHSLLSLINDILDFSKIEAGKMSIMNEPFNLYEEVTALIDTLTPIASAKGLDLKLTFKGELERNLVGDKNRIKQILINLIGNAIKFTDKGFVEVRIEQKKISEHSQHVRFYIVDTGIGIKMDKLKSLFNPYIQAHDIRASGSGGTGLGLYISKKLSDLMKGSIEVKSQFGIGSEFCFSLNLYQSEKSQKLIICELNQKNDKIIGRILLAEDNSINQMVTENFLKKTGLEVIIVNNGQEAVELLEKDSRFDLILMDCHMPVLDGYKATEIIRKSNKCYSEIPILALTASVLQEEREYCSLIGMNDFISKPVTFDVLKRKLTGWLVKAA